MLEGKLPNTPYSHTVVKKTAGPWTGSVLAGSPKYISVEGTFNVPKAIPGGDETTGTEESIWNGLGGFNTGSGLIQAGVNTERGESIAVGQAGTATDTAALLYRIPEMKSTIRIGIAMPKATRISMAVTGAASSKTSTQAPYSVVLPQPVRRAGRLRRIRE
jgi:hypothetical protein